MAVQHSVVEANQSYRVVDNNGYAFGIAPEYLEPAEIAHELRIRGLPTSGSNREVSKRLREAVINEVHTGIAPTFINTGLPSSEVNYVRNMFNRLELDLNNVNREDITQSRFMTLYIHLVGRAHRAGELARQRNQNDEATRAFECLERLTDFYNQFLQYRKRTPPPSTQRPLVNPNQQSLSNIEASLRNRHNRDSSLPTQTRTDNAPGTRPYSFAGTSDVQPIITVSRPDGVGAQAHIDNVEQLNNGQDNVEDNENEEGNNNDEGLLVPPPQAERDETRDENFDNNATDFNATLLPNGNARISTQFRQSNGAGITPIHPNDSSASVQQFLNNFANQDARINDYPNDESDDGVERHINVQNRQVDANEQVMPSERNVIEENVVQNPRMNAQANTGRTFDVPDRINGNIQAAPQAAARYSSEYHGMFRMNQQNLDPQARNFIPQRSLRAVDREGSQVNVSPAVVTDVNARRLDNLERLMTNMSQMLERLAVNLNQNVPDAPVQNARRLDNNINATIRNTSRHDQFVNNNRDHQPNVRAPQANFNNANLSTINNDSTVNRRNLLPVHKWPFKYTGDKLDKNPVARDLTAFFKRVDLFSRAESVNHDEIFSRIHHLLGGKALAWYSQYGTQYHNWDELQEGMRRHFETSLSRFIKMQKLNSRRQFGNETCMDYIAEMNQLFEGVGLDDESEKVAIIQNGLREEYRQIAHAQNWYSVEQLDHQLRKLEFSDDLRRKIRSTPWQRKDTHAVNVCETDCSDINANSSDKNETNQPVESTDDAQSIECMASNFKSKQWTNKSSGQQTGNAKKSKEGEDRSKHWTCFNCHETGHGYRDCESEVERVFCFRCGKEDVKSRECDCRPKNM